MAGSAKVEDIGRVSGNDLVEGSFRKSTIEDELVSTQSDYVSNDNQLDTLEYYHIPATVIDFGRFDSIISDYLTNASDNAEALNLFDPQFSIALFYWPIVAKAHAQNVFSWPQTNTRRLASCSGGASLDIIRCEARDGLFLPNWASSEAANSGSANSGSANGGSADSGSADSGSANSGSANSGSANSHSANSGYWLEQGSLRISNQDGVVALNVIPIGLADMPAAYYEIVFALYGGVAPMSGFNSADPFPGSLPANALVVPRVGETIPEAPLPIMLLIGAGGMALAHWRKKLGEVKAPPRKSLPGHGPPAGAVLG